MDLQASSAVGGECLAVKTSSCTRDKINLREKQFQNNPSSASGMGSGVAHPSQLVDDIFSGEPHLQSRWEKVTPRCSPAQCGHVTSR